ncbi:hypothetical protein SMICM304S_07410 [Streptomyces microflavus]
MAQAYTARHEDPALGALIPGVRKGCAMEFVREPGLFMGRAGDWSRRRDNWRPTAVRAPKSWPPYAT